ncbi:unnamed protein product [Arabis nemorensis]|uniref:CCHC-type domain-containing protein n=1 Tax=Arabis nemorensis TaxID=586526 RepID=A0A565C302_9BRAS|nr:unnamed protein product [Arabis nemorensis]
MSSDKLQLPEDNFRVKAIVEQLQEEESYDTSYELSTEASQNQDALKQIPTAKPICVDSRNDRSSRVKRPKVPLQTKKHISLGPIASDKVSKDVLKSDNRISRKASLNTKHESSALKSRVGTTSKFRGCFHCGKIGHRWQRCFKRKKKDPIALEFEKRLFEKGNLKGIKDNGCWYGAGHKELNQLVKNRVWNLIPLDSECKTTGRRKSINNRWRLRKFWLVFKNSPIHVLENIQGNVMSFSSESKHTAKKNSCDHLDSRLCQWTAFVRGHAKITKNKKIIDECIIIRSRLYVVSDKTGGSKDNKATSKKVVKIEPNLSFLDIFSFSSCP